MFVCTKKKPAKIELSQGPPTPLQALRMAQWNLLELVPKACLHQRVVSGKAISRFHMITDPPLIRDLLNTRVDDFPKGDKIVSLFQAVAFENIVSAHGTTWKKLRPPMAQAIHSKSLKDFSKVFTSAAEATSARIHALSGAPVDIESQMAQTTFGVISKLAFSEASPTLMATVQRALSNFSVEISRFSPLDFVKVPSWLPRPGGNAPAPTVAYGQKLVDSLIKQRKQDGPKKAPDILDKLLAAQQADPFITDIHVRDNLNVILIAGHDTAASSLSWALYLCAYAPEIQEAARQEARKVLQGRAAGLDDLKHLPLTTQIMKETMRLYPSFPLLVRKSLITETLHGVPFQKDDQVLIPLYALHRNRLFWDDPDQFIPSRFDGKTKINKYAYLPFGAGPRTCIGASFGSTQIQIQLATLLSRFNFSLIEGRTPKPYLNFSLISRNGIHLKATPVSRG